MIPKLAQPLLANGQKFVPSASGKIGPSSIELRCSQLIMQNTESKRAKEGWTGWTPSENCTGRRRSAAPPLHKECGQSVLKNLSGPFLRRRRRKWHWTLEGVPDLQNTLLFKLFLRIVIPMAAVLWRWTRLEEGPFVYHSHWCIMPVA